MVTQNTNPFVLPGFGQSGEMATNPMLASMEMMRKAWENLAGTGSFDTSMAVPGSSPEDLERRIADLRVVENWLRMNLSMLGSTIQALEVQRSTLATLQAFVASAGGGVTPDNTTPSPLDVALGIRRGSTAAPSADTSGLFGAAAQAGSGTSGQASAATRSGTGTTAGTDTGSPDASASEADSAAAPETAAATGPADAVMKSWWDMLQTQFDNLASATTATLQGAEAMQEAAAEAQKQAVESTRTATQNLQKSVAAGSSPAGKTAAKKTAKKTAAKKTAAKKSVAKKAAVKKTAARKRAAKTASAATAPAASRTAVKKATAKKSATRKTATRKTAAKKSGGSASK